MTETPSSSCSAPKTSQPLTNLAPISRARRRRIGSSPGWLTNQRRHGLSASTPSFRLGMKAASSFPARDSTATMAPSGSNSFSDWARTSSSIPAWRNSSKVRMWKKAALGRVEGSVSRSITRLWMPRCARNMAVDRPTRPPPAMITGASSATVAMPFSPIAQGRGNLTAQTEQGPVVIDQRLPPVPWKRRRAGGTVWVRAPPACWRPAGGARCRPRSGAPRRFPGPAPAARRRVPGRTARAGGRTVAGRR